MATEAERIVLTYHDYARIPSDRNRYELWEGEIQVTPAPGTAHQQVIVNLTALLVNHVRQHQLGRVLIAPCDVLLSDITVVQPDILFVSRERHAIVQPKYVQGAPDLVIEVLSPSTAQTDRHVKRQLYARYGVPHYWILDLKQRTAIALVLRAGAYRRVARSCGSEPFVAPPFPDLRISLAETWE